MEKPIRHILSISGGKDSTALAIYMKDRVPQMEYVFMDTGEELPETYEYLDRLEVYLARPIIRLNPERPFAHYLHIYRGVLPDARTRWCTRMLKLKPFEEFCGDEEIISYLAIRYDEKDRTGYISSKDNIDPCYPFIVDGLVKSDVLAILEDSGIGLPEYYRWRSRSGCYFCFFQRKIEWVGLKRNHPCLYEKAKAFEHRDTHGNYQFTWCQSESLEQLESTKRVKEIEDSHALRLKSHVDDKKSQFLVDIVGSADETSDSCLICHL